LPVLLNRFLVPVAGASFLFLIYIVFFTGYFNPSSHFSVNDSLLYAQKVNSELDMLLETIDLLEKSEESMNNYLGAVIKRQVASIYRNLEFFAAECPDNIGERIKEFGSRIKEEGTYFVDMKDSGETSSFRIRSFKRSIWTLKNLVMLGSKKIKENDAVLSNINDQRSVEKVRELFSVVSGLIFILLAYIVFMQMKIISAGKNLGLKKNINIESVSLSIENIKSEYEKERETTQKKLFREQISGRRKNALLDTIPAGMICASSTGEITYLNEKMKTWFDLNDTNIGEDIASIYPKLGIEKFEEGKIMIAGDFYWVSIETELNEKFFILRNITEQEKLSRKLLDSERLVSIGEMASRITHEIRNPLSTIKLNSEYLVENICEVDQEQIISSMKLIVKEVNRLETITEKYMNLVKYRSNSEVEKETEFPVDILQFISFHSTEFKKRKIEVLMDNIPQCDLAISGSSFKEIMLNLIKNAWEELDSEGKVSISVELEEQKAVIKIEDSGGGIPDEEKEAVFKNFYTKKPGGTGIGLSHSRKLAEEAGGSLTVTDSVLGGACFVLVVPVKITV
jgi:signal transduction histidine kinase